MKMLMHRLQLKFQIGLLVSILCCVSVTPAHGYVNEKFTSQQLIQDVDFYVKTLKETHINPFIYITENEWRAHVDKIKSQITERGPMTREEFWLLFAPLVSLIQDGHTSVVEPRFLLVNNTTKYLPVHTAYVNGKVVVTSSLADVPIARGTIITSINGIDSEDVVYKLSRYAYGSEKERIRFAGEWLWIGASEVFGKRESFALTFADRTNVNVQALTLSEMAAKAGAGKTSETSIETPLELEFLEGNIAYLNASTFSYDLEKYVDILRDVFTRIKRSGARHLIVDVRSNTGGNSELGDSLIDMFNAKPFKTYSCSWKRSNQYVESTRIDYKRYLALKPGELLNFKSATITPMENSLRFRGEVYVLSGEETFSSGLMFLALVKDNKLAKIIGEEPTTSACFAGEVYTFKLPNSGLRVSSAVKYWSAPAGCEGERGIVPDVVVTKQIEDYVKRRDRILEKTLEFIRERR